jgi:hypothetical protein
MVSVYVAQRPSISVVRDFGAFTVRPSQISLEAKRLNFNLSARITLIQYWGIVLFILFIFLSTVSTG